MRVAAMLVLLAAMPLAAQPALDVSGFVSLRGVNASGPDSWLAGGFGRLEAGAEASELFASAHAGIDWAPSKYFDVHVSGTARQDPGKYLGDNAGLVEAYVDLRLPHDFDEVRFRVGQFFLPTSRENRDPLWASPYTISFSALNTWMGQEVRPLGADLQLLHTTGGGHVLTAAGTIFKANDTMGTLLAWRGWSVGDRISTWGEVLPLPPIGSLDTWFFRQRDDGTKPFGPDLDGKPGYSARVRWSLPQRATIQYTWLDNRGNLKLYRGEYAWATDFHLIGFDAGDPDAFSVAGEYVTGTTEMGRFTNYVKAGFEAAYLLVSQRRDRWRLSARYDLFSTSEEDFSLGENNDESGRSWTFTWMYDLTPHLRGALEFTQVTGDRPAAQQYGFDPDTNAHALTLEARYRF